MDKEMKKTAVDRQFQMMTLILNEQQCHKFMRIAKEKEGDIHGGVIVLGKGTVKGAILNLLGIKSQKKEIVNILVEGEKAKEMLDFFTEELQLNQPGHGIAYTIPIKTADQIINKKQGEWGKLKGMEGEGMYKKLTVVVNRGMAEDVMDIARRSGVKGGTILHGRGTGSEATAKVFGMEIEPEKELVMILMPSDLVDKVVNDLFQELKMGEPGNGIMFVEPVAEVRGLVNPQQKSGKET